MPTMAEVILYRFTDGSSEYLYTSEGEDFSFGEKVYVSEPIIPPNIKQSDKVDSNSVKVQVPRTNLVAQKYIGGAPENVVTLTIFLSMRDASMRTVAWKGRVLQATFEGEQATLECEPLLVSLKRPGLRRRFQGACPHVLYGSYCMVVRAGYKMEAVVSEVDNRNLTVPVAATKEDGWFVAGQVQLDSGAQRMVLSHAGEVLQLTAPFTGLKAGDSVTLIAGCDRTYATCGSKFNNTDNFGGFRRFTTKNPFTGDPIM